MDDPAWELETLRMLLRASPSDIFWSDARGKVVRVFGQLHASAGYTAEEILGDGWARSLHPEDCDRVLAVWSGAIVEQVPVTTEYRLRGKDGALRWVLAQVAPVRDAAGRFKGHVGSITDITTQKRLEAALRESEERYRSLYEETPAMLHSIDPEGRLVSVSNRWLQVLGYEREEVIGRKSIDFMTDAARRHAIEVGLPTFMRMGFCRDIPYQLVKKDGEVIEVLLSAIAEKDADGRFVRSFGVLNDVTDRIRAERAARFSEARLKALIDNSPMLIFLKDVEGRYLLVNRVFETHHGLSNAEVRGKTAHELFPREEADLYATHDREVLTNAAPVEREYEWETPGGLRTFMTVKFPIFDSTGTLVGLGAIESDVSEHKRTLRELRAAKEQAERATRAKSDFLANMSHELRTPLNAIIGFSELMRNQLFGPLGADCYREYAADIHSSGMHLLELINDILDLSKVEAGKVELHEEDCDLGEVVAASLRFILARAQEKGLLIERQLDVGLPRLRADRRLLRQIILNLLSNSVKFTPEGGRITISAGLADTGGISVAISDTGIGMAPEDIPRALEPFEQIEGAFNRRYEGSGLGLPLARALAELHGATFRLESVSGVGTTATILFPVERSIREIRSERAI